MGSFYGTALSVSGAGASGSGTNYSELTNTPIKNLGSSTGQVVLSTLGPGHYNLNGNNFIYVPDDSAVKNANGTGLLDVYVVDGVKYAHYFDIQDGKLWSHIITFKEDGTCITDSSPINNNKTIEGDGATIFTDELPQEGTEGVLFVTKDSIYAYDGQKFNDLAQEKWEEF